MWFVDRADAGIPAPRAVQNDDEQRIDRHRHRDRTQCVAIDRCIHERCSIATRRFEVSHGFTILPPVHRARVESRGVVHRQRTVAGYPGDNVEIEFVSRGTGVGSVRWSEFGSILHATTVGIGVIPLRACHVLLPVLYAVPIDVSSIFNSGRICFSRIDDAVSIRVLLTIVELIAIRVVVARIRRLRRIAISAVDFDSILDTVAIGVDVGWIG